MPPSHISRITDISQTHTSAHQPALAWQARTSIQLSVIWIPNGWAAAPAQADLWDTILPETTRYLLADAFKQPGPQWPRRVDHHAAERFALPAAFHELFAAQHPNTPTPQHLNTLSLTHTPLGQPIIRLDEPLTSWVREHGLSPGDLHISFTHDGDAHITLLAGAPGLLGVGVDAVHLPRLRRHIDKPDYFVRFARQFMSPDELARFQKDARQEQPEEVMLRAAAHFSLMEAASKAVGTGLKIGGGMGKPTSLPKQSVNLLHLAPSVAFDLGPEADARCRALGASRLEGHWAADAEYLLSAVLLWK
jgi:phosphopantetheine--protein transferase-like protein